MTAGTCLGLASVRTLTFIALTVRHRGLGPGPARRTARSGCRHLLLADRQDSNTSGIASTTR